MTAYKKYSNTELKVREATPAYDRHCYNAECKNKSDVVQNPGKVDEELWGKAKEASQKSYGKIKWPFVTYMYEKLGGTFG